jgi:hypothetical protein
MRHGRFAPPLTRAKMFPRDARYGASEEYGSMQGDLTAEQLAALLRQAEKAHGEYERALGHRDDDWPTWYAAYIVKQLQTGR